MIGKVKNEILKPIRFGLFKRQTYPDNSNTNNSIFNKMNKKLLGSISALIITIFVALNINISGQNNYLSELSLANIEALADTESNERSKCSVEWTAKVGGVEVKLSCNADCAPGQKAECKQNNCKCT